MFNTKTLFDIADGSIKRTGLKLIKEITLDPTVKGFLYKKGPVHVITFTPFDYQGLFSFLNVGYQILYKQDLVDVGNGCKMNRFFYECSKRFVEEMKEELVETENLYVTGISLGAAIAQCFVYNLRQELALAKASPPVHITCFGSPRIGDQGLRSWFSNQKNMDVTNFVLFKKYGKVRKADPVCLFPHTRRGPYTNNHGLTMLFNGETLENAEYSIEQEDTDLSLWSYLTDNKIGKLWEDIHDVYEYWKNLN